MRFGWSSRQLFCSILIVWYLLTLKFREVRIKSNTHHQQSVYFYKTDWFIIFLEINQCGVLDDDEEDDTYHVIRFNPFEGYNLENQSNNFTENPFVPTFPAFPTIRTTTAAEEKPRVIKLQPFSVIFLMFYIILILTQFICMLWHRWDFAQLVKCCYQTCFITNSGYQHFIILLLSLTSARKKKQSNVKKNSTAMLNLLLLRRVFFWIF